MANFATFVLKTLLYTSIENKNGWNKVIIELSAVQSWSEIILVHVISKSSERAAGVRFKNGWNKVVIELSAVQFWSEIM